MCKLATDHTSDASAASPAVQTYEAIKEHLPATPLVKEAYDYVSARLPAPLLNHSIRVYLYSAHVSALSPNKAASPNFLTLAFIAAIFHDFGTSDECDGPDRFEVCGADAAASFLREHAPEITEAEVSNVWASIALHTSTGIAENYSELSRVIRLGVKSDFNLPGVRKEFDLLELVKKFEKVVPRLDVEKVLGDAVVKQVLKRQGEERIRKAPSSSWSGDLLRGELEKEEGYEGVNKYF